MPESVESGEHGDCGRELKEYRVVFRNDAAALTSIDDATADIGDIMDGSPQSSPEDGDHARHGSDYIRVRAEAAERGTHLHSIMADLETATTSVRSCRGRCSVTVSPNQMKRYIAT